MIIDAPTPAQMPALRAMWVEAFGDSEEFFNTFERTAFSAERCRCVSVDRQTVAALYWFECACRERRIAYLYAIATARSHRGRGLCRALMEDTHKHLKALGFDGALLVPAERGLFDLYEKLGYRVCCEINEFSVSASEKKAELRRINAKEYAALRRRLLPEGGVIQENENLDFLQTMAELLSGEGFLLAARREGNTLIGAELLGDTSAAPAVVSALGCAEGRFRTNGEGRPFAMYRPLCDTAISPPTYFGLAFD